MGTKLKPGKFDCYAKAAEDEPIFVLRAKDPLAPDIVRHWAQSYQLHNEIANSTGDGPEALTASQHEKYTEAMACANAMVKWKSGGGRTPLNER